MRYLKDQELWLLSPPNDADFEILVGGDATCPNAERLAVVERAVTAIDTLRNQAVAYIEAFVDKGKFAESTNWYFEGIESGASEKTTEQQFSLHFSIEGDTYAQWSVSFQVSGNQYVPIGFSRRQI